MKIIIFLSFLILISCCLASGFDTQIYKKADGDCPDGQVEVCKGPVCQPGKLCPLYVICSCVNKSDTCDLSISSDDSCGAQCQATCKSPVNPQVCTDICRPGCRCDQGYLLDDTDGSYTKCVLPGQCPVTCDLKTSNYTDCDANCQPTCENKKPGSICSKICQRGCKCKSGYYLDNSDERFQKCVKANQCPKPVPTCPENSEYRTCGSRCAPTCPPRPLTNIFFSFLCSLRCIRGCFCKTGYVLDTNAYKCIKQGECQAASIKIEKV